MNGATPRLEVSFCVPTLNIHSKRTMQCLLSVRHTLKVPYEVVVIENHYPQGYTAPANAAIRTARAPYIVVVNDDVVFLRGWWEPLRERLDRGASVVFPQTVEGFHRDDFAAWCFAMTAETRDRYSVQEGEFFHPRMKVWYQDTDLLRRLSADGRSPQCVYESTIRHGLSQTLEDPSHKGWIAEQIQEDALVFQAACRT